MSSIDSVVILPIIFRVIEYFLQHLAMVKEDLSVACMQFHLIMVRIFEFYFS